MCSEVVPRFIEQSSGIKSLDDGWLDGAGRPCEPHDMSKLACGCVRGTAYIFHSHRYGSVRHVTINADNSVLTLQASLQASFKSTSSSLRH